MKILNHIFRIVVGLVFILSGLAKLFPIEPFEIIFVDLGISNWVIAPFLARFIIAFELFLGLCIIFDLWLKGIVYKVTQGSLIVFTIYLIYILITKGNNTGCGCFGSFIELSPLESIAKNVLLMILLMLIKKRHYQLGTFNLVITPLFLAMAFSSTFLLNRVGLQNVQGIEINEEVDYSAFPALYKNGEKVNFTEGKKIVVFLSVSCSHCESVSHKLHYLQTQHKIENLYVVLASKHEENIQPFLDKTKIDFPMIWFNDEVFFSYSGVRLPAFVYLENGVLKKKWTGEFFKVEELEELLTQ